METIRSLSAEAVALAGFVLAESVLHALVEHGLMTESQAVDRLAAARDSLLDIGREPPETNRQAAQIIEDFRESVARRGFDRPRQGG